MFNASFSGSDFCNFSDSGLLYLFILILSCCADVYFGGNYINILLTCHRTLVDYYVSRKIDIIK